MKTASSSVEMNYAQNFAGKDDVISKLDEGEGNSQNNEGWFNPIPELIDGSYTLYKTAFQFYHKFKFGPHQSARVIKNRIPRKIWKSYFKFTIERNPYDKMVSMYFMNWGKDGVDRPGKSFEDWVKRGENFPINYPLYTWKNQVLVDEVVRFENLEEGLKSVYAMLGVPFSELTENAKGSYRIKQNYREIHTDFTRQNTERVFRKELDLFDYSF